MTKLRSILCSLATLIFCLTSCTSSDLSLSSDFADSKTYATCMSNMNIELSTFKMDSVQTSDQNIIWVGKVTKPVLGDIHSESYFRVTEPLYGGVRYYSWLQSEKEIYDSVCIVLRHTGDYQGDTTKAIELDVRLLSKRLEFDKTDYGAKETAFYDCREFPDSISIGTFRFVPRPHTLPRVRYRLSDEWGRKFVEFIKEAKNYTADAQTQRFNSYIPGVKIQAAEGSDPQALLAFRADSAQIVIHSHIRGMVQHRIERSLRLTDSNLQFNHIWTENITKPYDKLVRRLDNVTESEGGGHSVLFEGLGYYTRVNFPKDELLELNGYYGHIVRAILKLRPEKGSYDRREIKNFRTVYLYEINENNVLGNQLYSVSGTASSATLYFNALALEESYYAIDVTYYLNTLLSSDDIKEGQGIVVMWQNGMLPTNYNFMLFSGHSKELFKSELEIYYYDYNRIY